MVKRRPGTNAGKGLVFENQICMLLMQRCAKYAHKFEIMSNVDGPDEVFDDVVLKVHRQDKVQHLFLQAKNKSGKSASIFEKTHKIVKRGESLPKYPREDICKLFQSFGIRSKQCGPENFELVYFAIIDIEDVWKPLFEETSESLFADLLVTEPVEDSSGLPLAKPKVYKLKTSACKEILKEQSEEEIEYFCARMKIYALQPDHSKLETLIKREIGQSDIYTEWIYSYVYQRVNQWTLLTETDKNLDKDLFQEAEDTKDISQFEIPAKNLGTEFCFRTEAMDKISVALETGGNVTSLIVPAETSRMYVDLIKQQINREGKVSNLFLFKLPDIHQNIAKVLQFSASIETDTYCTVKILDLSNNTESVKDSVNDLIQMGQETCNLKFIFLVEESIVSSDKFPEDVPSQHHVIPITFSSLSRETQEVVLEQRVEIMGRYSALSSLVKDRENLIDHEILADIRNKKHIVFGRRASVETLPSSVYISRTLEVRNMIKDTLKLLKSQYLKDKYIVICSEAEKSSILKEVQKCHQNVEFIDTAHHEAKFKNLCSEFPNQGVHKFKIKDAKLFWFQSGNLKAVKDNIYSLLDSVSISEQEIFKETIDNPLSSKVSLISSNAGMGKTTLAHSIANKACTDTLTYWPVLVTLNKHQQFYNALQKGKNHLSALDLLHECVGPQQFSSLKKFMKLHGRVLVFLDGFDEIAPIYTELVLSIIDSMCEKNIYKLVILTRPHLAETIRKHTGALSLGLTTFTQEDVGMYVSSYYTKEMPHLKKERSSRLELFCEQLTKFIFSEMRSFWTDITCVPLQARMVVDVFTERCREYIETGSETLLPSDKDAHINYHEEFVKMKIKICVEEKMNLPKLFISEFEDVVIDKLYKLHSACATFYVFDEVKGKNYFKFDTNPERDAEKTIRCGIVTAWSTEYTEFIHRSFAEYYCAEKSHGYCSAVVLPT